MSSEAPQDSAASPGTQLGEPSEEDLTTTPAIEASSGVPASSSAGEAANAATTPTSEGGSAAAETVGADDGPQLASGEVEAVDPALWGDDVTAKGGCLEFEEDSHGPDLANDTTTQPAQHADAGGPALGAVCSGEAHAQEASTAAEGDGDASLGADTAGDRCELVEAAVTEDAWSSTGKEVELEEAFEAPTSEVGASTRGGDEESPPAASDAEPVPAASHRGEASEKAAALAAESFSSKEAEDDPKSSSEEDTRRAPQASPKQPSASPRRGHDSSSPASAPTVSCPNCDRAFPSHAAMCGHKRHCNAWDGRQRAVSSPKGEREPPPPPVKSPRGGSNAELARLHSDRKGAAAERALAEAPSPERRAGGRSRPQRACTQRTSVEEEEEESLMRGGASAQRSLRDRSGIDSEEEEEEGVADLLLGLWHVNGLESEDDDDEQAALAKYGGRNPYIVEFELACVPKPPREVVLTIPAFGNRHNVAPGVTFAMPACPPTASAARRGGQNQHTKAAQQRTQLLLTESWLQCDVCEEWFSGDKLRLTPEQFEHLASQVTWTCADCDACKPDARATPPPRRTKQRDAPPKPAPLTMRDPSPEPMPRLKPTLSRVPAPVQPSPRAAASPSIGASRLGSPASLRQAREAAAAAQRAAEESGLMVNEISVLGSGAQHQVPSATGYLVKRDTPNALLAATPTGQSRAERHRARLGAEADQLEQLQQGLADPRDHTPREGQTGRVKPKTSSEANIKAEAPGTDSPLVALKGDTSSEGKVEADTQADAVVEEAAVHAEVASGEKASEEEALEGEADAEEAAMAEEAPPPPPPPAVAVEPVEVEPAHEASAPVAEESEEPSPRRNLWESHLESHRHNKRRAQWSTSMAQHFGPDFGPGSVLSADITKQGKVRVKAERGEGEQARKRGRSEAGSETQAGPSSEPLSARSGRRGTTAESPRGTEEAEEAEAEARARKRGRPAKRDRDEGEGEEERRARRQQRAAARASRNLKSDVKGEEEVDEVERTPRGGRTPRGLEKEVDKEGSESFEAKGAGEAGEQTEAQNPPRSVDKAGTKTPQGEQKGKASLSPTSTPCSTTRVKHLSDGWQLPGLGRRPSPLRAPRSAKVLREEGEDGEDGEGEEQEDHEEDHEEEQEEEAGKREVGTPGEGRAAKEGERTIREASRSSPRVRGGDPPGEDEADERPTADKGDGEGGVEGEGWDDEAYARALQREFMGLRGSRHSGEAAPPDGAELEVKLVAGGKRARGDEGSSSQPVVGHRSKRLAIAV